MHGALLSLLQQAGSCISLIGDPNQAIFEFADADGTFLRAFNTANGVLPQPLSENRRSVGAIVTVANELSATASKAIRENPERIHGAYLMRYGERTPSIRSSRPSHRFSNNTTMAQAKPSFCVVAAH